MSDGRIVAIIDDDEPLGRSMAKVLTNQRFTVELFPNGRSFLDQVSRIEEFGTLLLDLHMPDVGGLELFSALQDLEGCPGVVFLTGFGDVPASVEAMKMGAVDFLPKPMSSEALIDAVERSIASTDTARARRRESTQHEPSTAPRRGNGGAAP